MNDVRQWIRPSRSLIYLESVLQHLCFHNIHNAFLAGEMERVGENLYILWLDNFHIESIT